MNSIHFAPRDRMIQLFNGKVLDTFLAYLIKNLNRNLGVFS